MICASLALFLAVPAAAGPDGRIRVIDGDTIDVGTVRVRLHGIDAPERDQTCTRPNGAVWECGAWSGAQVRALYQGQRARCQTIDRDRHGRVVAKCRVKGADIGAEIVRAGLATAFVRYSRDYVDVEKEAIVSGRGIFGSEMAPPAEHRSRVAASDPAPQGCRIKGNISGNGRIYHLPGQENYNRTRISTSKGERWFCSEAEARQAGWRRARR